MYTLILVTASALLGTYNDLPSCQDAIRAIYTFKINPYNFQNPEIEKAINTNILYQREYVCIPNKKG